MKVLWVEDHPRAQELLMVAATSPDQRHLAGKYRIRMLLAQSSKKPAFLQSQSATHT